MNEVKIRPAMTAEQWESFTRGFTREDVAILREMAHEKEAEHDDPDSPMRDELVPYEQFTLLYSLADRIEALLPPED